MKKIYITIILASLFLGTLVLMYGFNLTNVVASTSHECGYDSDCSDDDRWCSHNTVHEEICNDGSCQDDHNDDCDIPAGGTCVEEGDWAICEYQCLYDSDCAYSGVSAYCSGNVGYEGYCDLEENPNECKISQEDCTPSEELCHDWDSEILEVSCVHCRDDDDCPRPGDDSDSDICAYLNDECIDCYNHDDCDSPLEMCDIPTQNCVPAEFYWETTPMPGYQASSNGGIFLCEQRSDVSRTCYDKSGYWGKYGVIEREGYTATKYECKMRIA